LDSTPGIWDVLVSATHSPTQHPITNLVKFYNETLNPIQPANTFRFPSDTSIAQEDFASVEWKAFALGNSQVHAGLGNALSKTLANSQLHWDSVS
jgi:hypothetical protein